MDSSLPFMYGTAWKRQQTADLVSKALEAGFRSFDTAAQPKHYREDLVGEGLRALLSQGTIRREDLFIQTKFSRPYVQDPSNSPYSLDAPLKDQIRTSIQSSLNNLRHEDGVDSSYLDALLLHSPYPEFEDTLKAWRIFSEYVPHKIRALGISNVSLAVLEQISDAVEVKPTFVQARFHPETQLEGPMRKFCREKGFGLQAHKILKGNKELLVDAVVGDVAENVSVSRKIALYLCIIGLEGISVVNGTKSVEHMKEHMDGWSRWNEWVKEEGNTQLWDECMGRFRRIIRDIMSPNCAEYLF